MFCTEQFLPAAVIQRLTDKRVSDPEYAYRAAQLRKRRDSIAPDGKLNILAADHPARRVTKVGGNPVAMANRGDYLGRILRVLTSDRVDGVMATMDILEDLLALDGFIREAGGKPLLDGKVLIASLNRGGLAGSSWELDDPVTGATPATCDTWSLDGAKLLLRVMDGDAASLKTMRECARAINEANALRIPTFLEPLPVAHGASGYTVVKQWEELAQLAGVASALGESSRYLWLKLPYCENFEAVACATTLPILILGGESAGDPAPFLNQLDAALSAGSNVRGALVGRNVLYPGPEDPRGVGEAAGGIVHERWTVAEGIRAIEESRGAGMDRISQYF